MRNAGWRAPPLLLAFLASGHLTTLPTWAQTAGAWAPPVWIVGYLTIAALVVWPFKVWKAQRDELKKHTAGDHIGFAEMFGELMQIYPTTSQED